MSPPSPTVRAGRCHCDAVRFAVRLTAPTLIVCDCSICTKKGFLHLIVEKDDLTIEAGADALQTYRFHTRTAQHLFCRICGMHPFYVPRSHPDGWSVNARCLDDQAFVRDLPVQPFAGRAWEDHIHQIR